MPVKLWAMLSLICVVLSLGGITAGLDWIHWSTLNSSVDTLSSAHQQLSATLRFAATCLCAGLAWLAGPHALSARDRRWVGASFLLIILAEFLQRSQLQLLLTPELEAALCFAGAMALQIGRLRQAVMSQPNPNTRRQIGTLGVCLLGFAVFAFIVGPALVLKLNPTFHLGALLITTLALAAAFAARFGQMLPLINARLAISAFALLVASTALNTAGIAWYPDLPLLSAVGLLHFPGLLLLALSGFRWHIVIVHDTHTLPPAP